MYFKLIDKHTVNHNRILEAILREEGRLTLVVPLTLPPLLYWTSLVGVQV